MAAARARKDRPLQRVRERADGELRDQPDQIGRQTAVHGAGPDGGLVAGQRGRQQRAGVEAALSIAEWMCSATSPAPLAASSPHNWRRVTVRTATGSGIGSPARAGTPRPSLAALFLAAATAAAGVRPQSSR